LGDIKLVEIKVIRKYESNNDLYNELIDLLLQLLKLHLSNNLIMVIDNDGHLPKWLRCVVASVHELISGGIAVAAGVARATLTGIVGGVTVAAGLGTATFASEEIQQSISGNNWILDAGMSKEWYNGLITTASIATLGTFASSFCTSFNIKSINQLGKFGDYHGMRFTTGNGKERVLSFHILVTKLLMVGKVFLNGIDNFKNGIHILARQQEQLQDGYGGILCRRVLDYGNSR